MKRDFAVAMTLKIGGIILAIGVALLVCYLLEQIHASNYLKATCVSFAGFLCYETADLALVIYRKRRRK